MNLGKIDLLYTTEEGVEKMESISLNKIKRQETEAYKASVEIDRILHYETEGNYRLWQFENYKITKNTLKTTYDELFILWKEEARFRQGFKVEDDTVIVPNIFAKISGTHRDLELYWNELDQLKNDNKTTIFINSIPFTSPHKNHSFNKCILNDKELFDLDIVKSMDNYPLAYLKTSSQNLILSKINEMIQSKDLFNFEITTELKYKILDTILNLKDQYLNLIQNFDYPFKIPKLVVFDSSKNIFSQEDIISLVFLHLVGFDIVIFTPTGYNNLEKYINDLCFDTHRLEEVQYNLQSMKNTTNHIGKPKRKRITAGILAIFLGGLGGHKFYLGRPIQGVLMLLFWWTLIPTIVGIVQGVEYLKNSDETFIQENKEIKRVTAGLLAIFFGGFGIHKFYLGKVFQGLLHFIFFFTLIPFVIGIKEGLKYLKATDQEFYLQYC